MSLIGGKAKNDGVNVVTVRVGHWADKATQIPEWTEADNSNYPKRFFCLSGLESAAI